jgi:hypothetical protein
VRYIIKNIFKIYFKNCGSPKLILSNINYYVDNNQVANKIKINKIIK